MNDEHTDSSSPSPKAPSAARPSIPLMRICGVLLLALAVYLYAHDVSANSRRAKAAEAVRNVASAPTIQVAICTNPQPQRKDEVWEIVRDRACASNILAHLAAAEPKARSDGHVMERVYEIMLVQTNHASSYLRARRIPGSDELWVSLLQPRRVPDAKEGEPPFIEFDPAVVTGLGKLFDEFDTHNVPTAEQLRAAAQTAAYTNLPLRADTGFFTEEEVADVPAALRKVAGLPLQATSVSDTLLPAGPTPVSTLPPALGERIRQSLLGAQSTETPKTLEGTECLLRMFLANGRCVNLRIAVPDATPDDALVGFLEFVHEDDNTLRLVPSPAALVPGLGALISEALHPAPVPEAE